MSRRKTDKNLVKSTPGTPPPNAGKDGKILTQSREYSRPLRERAREMLEDPEYCDALAARLLIGEAGAVEVWLYRFGYGDPKADRADEEAERQRFDAVRKEVQDIIRKGKAEGKVLDMAVGRASRKLAKLPEAGPLGVPDDDPPRY